MKAEINSYTIIYRDKDGELKEGWHCLSNTNVEYIKEKYKEQKKEIYRFLPKHLPFGEYLKTISGDSKAKNNKVAENSL
jgi:hypothetical protein